MKRFISLRLTLCLFLLGMVCNVAWADITQQWTSAPSPWGTTNIGEYPTEVGANLTTAQGSKTGTVRKAETKVTKAEGGAVTIVFEYTNGGHKLNILGVDLVGENGQVAYSDYHYGKAPGDGTTKTYTLQNVAAGDYTLRYFVCNNSSDGDQLTMTNGNITVTGLDVYVEKKTYTINIEGGQTIKIGENTYSNGDTYTTEGSLKKGDITVVAPNGQFAAVSIDDVNGVVNVYFATIPNQTASATYTNAVVYPLQQTAVGAAQSAESNGVYTLRNNVLAASFAKMGGALYFAGSKAMDLLPGTEPFTVAFGDGDNVPASAMTLKSVALQNLEAKNNAVGGAEHYAGKAIVANYEYTYNDCTLTIVWRAVLRDGSHYLRTEMELTGENDVDMFNIIPMIYNVDTQAAGSTPAVVGNTRGAVLMSNKIFAGLETPTAYNTVGDATGEEDNWNLTTSVAPVTLEASAWTVLEAGDGALARLTEVTGAGHPNVHVYKQTDIELQEGQKVEVKVEYKSGSNKLYLAGADLYDSNNSIAANDYHEGYAGSSHDKNVFTIVAPHTGTYTIRVFVHNKQEAINAKSELTTKIYTPKEGVVINTDIVGIQGRWSRNTTLAAGETWKVGAVVGLIAQDGTQANADIHSTQKRRSFLAYSERERAVPYRALPMYLAWYELQINRNNAAPGREHLDNTKEADVLDVLKHWKEDFYGRYGVAPEIFIVDDGWDKYGEWTFHDSFPEELRNMSKAAKEMDNAGIGAWLGPVGGYGQSGNYRRDYWNGKGGMQLSNPAYYAAFKKAAHNLVKNQGDNYVFFKFDGISGQFSSVGPDAGDTGNENAEGIIRLEQYVREELREDIFFNTSVGTWASPFWYQITDATWRQENDHDRTGNNTTNRENWITYRDRLVYQNYVKNSPICPINTLMTHGFILTKFGPPASDERDYLPVRNELRAAFLCGSGMVELYNDYDLMNSINGGALWADLAECIAWQKRNEDVLPDAHWVGGNPWTGAAAQVYGWAAWNGTKSTLALRNGANDAQTYTFTLRQALNIPANVNGSIILRSAFGDQAALEGLTEGKAYGIDESITVTLPGSSVYGFEGIASNATINKVSSIELTSENSATQVEIDNTLVLKAAVNADATFPALTWTSSNPEVATVSGGLVVPVKTGTTTITAEAKDGSGITATMTLTVIPDMDATVVTDLVQLSNEKVYTLRSTRAFLFYRPESNKLCSSTGTAVGSVTLDNKNPKHQFRIEKIGENYYLYSVGAEKYVAKDGTFVATPTDALTFTDVSASRANFPWQLALGGNGMNSQGSGQTAEGIVFNSYNTTDDGNCYTIEVGVPKSYVYTVHILGADGATVTYDETAYQDESTFETKAEFTESDFTPSTVDGKFSIVNIDGNDIYVSYFANDTQFYTIHGGHNGYLSLGDGYHSNGELLLTKTDVPKDNKALWTFVEQTGGGYKIYNYSTGLSKVLGMTGNGADARATMVALDASTHATVFEGTFNFDGTASYIKSKDTNNWWNKRGNFLAYWNTGSVTGDQGSQFYLEEVEYTNYPDVYIHEISNITGVNAFTPKNPNTLWYKTSAEASGVSYPWMEYALPLGNGELGCMVFGGVAHEELQFNEKTLWSGPANTVGADDGNRTFMNFGSLIIANNDASIYTEGVTDYVRYLDIEEGIAGVEFKNANGTKQTRKYLSSAPDQVIAGQYKSVGDDKLNLTFSLEPGNGINASAVTYEGNTASFSGKMTVEYAARLHVVAIGDGATVTATKAGIKVENATEVNFYLKGATNFNGDMNVLNNYFTADDAAAINTRVAEELEATANKGFEEIEADHVEDFTAITKRMTFNLGLTTPTVDTKTLVDNYYPNNTGGTSTENDHLFLEQLYFHYGRYLAISSNRKAIAAPNNLQGIWNDRGTNSPWNSDIHTNINIQMNYWPTEITNLSDLHKPFVNFIIRGAQSEGWKEVANNYNDGHGWSTLTETSLYNSMSTWGNNYLVANVWYTSHLWTHWRYTQDKEFLKQAFPVMWSAAEFWFHRLIEDRGYDSATQNSGYRGTPYSFEPDGTYVAPNEYSAEQDAHNSEDGTAHAQQMISYLFQNISDAIKILGRENVSLTDEQIATLNEYLQKTDKGLHTEVYTANSALNGGWTNPRNGVNQGDTILREWKYSPYDVSSDPGHRHLSHLMALFPMDQITPESEYFEPAVNSLKLRGDAATGWSMGWKVNLWARAQDGDHAHIIIKNALKHSTDYGTNAGAGGIYYNLFDSHAPFQIDGNFGVCSGIAEMLMQSAHGYINILPALPTVWENTGTITGMKAMGNFTVDFNWKNGKAQKVKIVSNAGAELKVRCNRGAVEIANAMITVDGDEVAVTVENGIATIPCAQGQIVVIDFTQEASPATFSQKWTASPVAPWSATATDEYPTEVAVNGLAVHKAETAVTATRGGDVTINFVYSGGSHKLNILGVDLVDAEGTVVASDYHHGTTGGSHSNNNYTLTGVAAGDYTLRYFVGQGNGDALNQTNGNITVIGLALTGVAPSKLPQAGKYYRIGYDFGGDAGVKYMQSTASGVSGKANALLMTADKGEGSIFLVEEVGGNLRLKSVATGKYLKETNNNRGLADEGANVTFTEGTDGKIKIAATSYLHPNVSGTTYFVDRCGNDGCAQHNLIVEEVKVRSLEVEGPAYVGASATWNGETKALPATWVIFDGITINNPTLSIKCPESYSFTNLTEDGSVLGKTVNIESLTANRTITANFNIAFFSASTAEKDLVPVRIRNVRNADYTLRLNANDNYTGKAVNSGKTAYGENEIWYLVGTAESFKIYNRVAGTGLHMVLAGTGSGSAASMNTTATNADFCLVTKDNGYAITPKANKEQSFNMHGGAGADIKLYGAGDGGSIWVVEKMDVNNPITLNVEVDKVWESSPRVAELTFSVDGVAGQTRILGSVEGQALYLPLGATYEVSSMTYRGYTYNGCEGNDGVLTASYTANDERTLYYTPSTTGKPYRIPAIATAPNGHIFAIADHRPCGNDIGYGEVDIMCRISEDNGVTWSNEFYIADGQGGDSNHMTTGYGDAAIVADRESNKLLVMMVCGRTVCHNGRWDTSKIGDANATEVNRVARIYLTYNESTGEWENSEIVEMTDHIYSLFLDGETPTVTSMFIGSGKVCQSRVVKKGDYYRLYCSMWTRDGGNRVIYSDDFGGSWNVLGTINDRPASGGDEPKVEELPDGTVVLSSRKGGGRYFNLFTFADDTYTTGTWGTVASSNNVSGGLSFGGNSTNGEIYKVKAIRKSDGQICDVMLQSIPTGSGRTDVAVYYKEMEYNADGTNKYTPETFSTGWTKGKHVSTKGSCYSTMVMQADGRLAFLFEEEPGSYSIVYIPYTIEDVTGNAYSLYTVNSSIGQYEIGTFYASEAMQIPEGVKAYVAEETPVMDDKDAEGNAVGTITMRELENLIPAKTGVVILGAQNNYKFMPSISYGAEVAGNMLKGWEANNVDGNRTSAVALPTDGTTNYVLTVMNGAAGFYKKDKGFNVYNNKAYLNVRVNTKAIRLRFNNNDGTTDIIEVPTEALNGNGEIYDLSGRRVEKATKGVFIVNGKKVIF